MAKTKKPLRISESMVKRYLRSDGQQSKGSPCIICGDNFEDCVHSFAEVERVIDVLKIGQMLGLSFNQPEPVAPVKRLVFFKECIIDVDDISYAVRENDYARGFNFPKESVMVHFLSAKDPLLVFGVTMAEFTEAVKQART